MQKKSISRWGWALWGALFLTGPKTMVSAGVNSEAFFPQTKGSEWVYDTYKKGAKKPFEMKVVIEDSWKDEGGSGQIMKQKDKRGTMREFLLTNEKGVFITKLGLAKSFTPEIFTRFNPPVPRVIFPLDPGTQVHWEGRLKVATINKKILFDGEVTGWEEIEVPAGKFKCIKLYYDEKRGDEAIVEEAWYAEGVGQVKYKGGEYVKELKSYSIK